MASTRVTITPGLQALFQGARELGKVEAIISSNLAYMIALEYGHSSQAPAGMVRTYSAEYQAMLADNLLHGLETYQGDLVKAARAGVTFGALEIMRAIADRTPVDTGRAKNDWIVTRPDGVKMSDSETGQSPVSAEQQKAIYKTAAWKKRHRKRLETKKLAGMTPEQQKAYRASKRKKRRKRKP